ncbi:MAG TPA: cytochrome c oxidase subunit II [Gaiellaceae bacterium]|nr:cytochrome c oxidase subunit II [Gaiellaceae bacterium]
MAADPAAAPRRPTDSTNHGLRVVVAWLVLSAVATPLVAIFVGRLIPPGNGSVQGTEQVFDNTWMVSVVTPVICLLAVFFVYGLFSFRAAPGAAVVDGPPLRNDSQIQVLWIVITSVIVLFLAGFGSYELLQNGAGGGQGPNPVAIPSGPKMQVQVIGQQWQFTYRYPSLGGLESNQLVLPANTDIELHVTSLDVVHSFWAYELGVKADANPGVDNVAYVFTKGPETFHVRCAELCGLWHPYMFNNGRVVDSAQFHAWAAKQQKLYAAIKPFVNKSPDQGGTPYAHTYLPQPQRRAG